MRMRHGLTDSTGMNKELKFCICAWSTAICQKKKKESYFPWPKLFLGEISRTIKLLLPASVRQRQSGVGWFLLGRQIRRDTCRESPNRRDPADTKPQSTVSQWVNAGKSELEFQRGSTTRTKQDGNWPSLFSDRIILNTKHIWEHAHARRCKHGVVRWLSDRESSLPS